MILINAGHGGSDCGAVGKNGLQEAKVNLNVAKLTQRYLGNRGIESVIYQQKNSLNEIIKIENQTNFEFGISIHCNASVDRSANGIEVLYYPTSKKGKELAQCIQDELIKKTGLRDRGIKARSDLGFLKRTKSTCVLVECAFISNEKEEQMLKDDYSIFAQGITLGIVKYLENSK